MASILVALCSKAQNPYAIPYSQNFNSVNCISEWRFHNTDNDSGEWVYADSTNGFGYQQSGCFVYVYSSYNQGNDWLISPGFVLSQGVNYMISFKYAVGSIDYVEKLKVFIGSDSLPASMNTMVQDFNSLNSENFNTCDISFIPDSSGVYYMGFYAYSDPGQLGIFIDEFNFELQGADLSSFNMENIITIYPNPVSDILSITNCKDFSISVSDLNGNDMLSFMCEEDQKQIDIRSLHKGIYFIRSESKGIVVVKKVIII